MSLMIQGEVTDFCEEFVEFLLRGETKVHQNELAGPRLNQGKSPISLKKRRFQVGASDLGVESVGLPFVDDSRSR